jgi:alpha-tubulin suppressor-like RCC1 family protein
MNAIPVARLTALFPVAPLALALAMGSVIPNAAAAPQLSARAGNTCAVMAGVAWCWGYNSNGQLGNNSLTESAVPVQMVLSSGASTISTSGAHACAVVNGAAWCWGKNNYGQLGDNTLVQSLLPVQVTGLTAGVTAIAAGDNHTCAVVNGGVKCWGENARYGQLGNGSSTDSAVPVSVTGLASGVTALSAGLNHTCALVSGAVNCWGRGNSGELGNGATVAVSRTPVVVTGSSGTSILSVGGSFACTVKSAAATCWGWGGQGQLGNNSSTGGPLPQQVFGLTGGVSGIAAGSANHACAIVNGGAQCWGSNSSGQLGNPAFGGGSYVPVAVSSLASGVTEMSAGGSHTCATAAAGLYCWGLNANGQLGNGSAATSNVPLLAVPASALATTLAVSPATLDLGGQSMNTTSLPKSVTITNTGAAAVTLSKVSVSPQFSQTNTCGALAPGASCTVTVTFTPSVAKALAGTLVATSSAGTLVADLTGTGERSLVAHYYQSILRRAPDAGGKAYWDAEAARVQALGVNVNEVWFAMAGSFYSSAEYTALNRDNAGYVTDLYGTFFNRAPDAAGFADWKGQLDAGMPREVVLASFMFSSEFATFTRTLFGTAITSKEVDTVVDFYRGLLGALPDDGGFNYWLQLFRTAQCQGAVAVNTQVESISSAFASSSQYVNRGRTNAQYVGDLYNAFLRRGGDLAGVQFWIGQVDSGARTRENVRQAFVASSEFSARVAAIIENRPLTCR